MQSFTRAIRCGSSRCGQTVTVRAGSDGRFRLLHGWIIMAKKVDTGLDVVACPDCRARQATLEQQWLRGLLLRTPSPGG
jgi:hypothetical protein